MNWNELKENSQLDYIIQEESKIQPVVIFKHSTRCSISSMALNRLERSWNLEGNKAKPYLLDLISFRDISNSITQKLQTEHQSPQILLIKSGEVIYSSSHMSISFDEIKSKLD